MGAVPKSFGGMVVLFSFFCKIMSQFNWTILVYCGTGFLLANLKIHMVVYKIWSKEEKIKRVSLRDVLNTPFRHIEIKVSENFFYIVYKVLGH